MRVAGLYSLSLRDYVASICASSGTLDFGQISSLCAYPTMSRARLFPVLMVTHLVTAEGDCDEHASGAVLRVWSAEEIFRNGK